MSLADGSLDALCMKPGLQRHQPELWFEPSVQGMGLGIFGRKQSEIPARLGAESQSIRTLEENLRVQLEYSVRLQVG